MKTIPFMLSMVICQFGCSILNAQETPVNISVDTLAKQVYMLTGQGGNIGIYVGEDYVFMIDDQFDRLSDKIKASIATLSDKPIAFLLNTHMHGDHSGGNAKFNSGETVLVAHDNVRDRIGINQKAKLEAKEITEEEYKLMLPEVTFSNDIAFFDGDERILAFHVHNAHTDGDAMVYFANNNVLHMGDTFFAGRYPYIDLGSGGSVNGLIEAQKKALMIINEDTKIIPGHGRPSTRIELEAFLAMLQDIKAKVQSQIDLGKTLEEVVADKVLTAEYDASFGSGFINPERLRETFYNSLKEK
jgi:glyoxylase-like metal-dependent hydrolase (beta-lactamase superfamily II)